MSLVQSAGLVNSQNAHFPNPGFSSKVGAVSGCGGSVNSALALEQKGLYQVVKTGGKKRGHGKMSRKNRMSKKYRGGNGYGFATSQNLASSSGVNSGGSVHLAEFSKYENKGMSSDTNMDASKQSGGKVKKHSSKKRMSHASKKRRSHSSKKRRSHSSKKIMSHSSKKRRSHSSKKRRHSKKHMQRGGYSQYISNVASTPGYSAGGIMLGSNESALANPVPFTPTNTCMNSWKHLGDSAPYNKSV
jgi:hypothetical protein